MVVEGDAALEAEPAARVVQPPDDGVGPRTAEV